MSTEASKGAETVCEVDAKNLKYEYYKLRLGQTLQHTQQTVRQLWLIDAAILGGVAFLLGKETNIEFKEYFAGLLLMTLGIVNVITANIIKNQQYWFNGFDELLRKEANALKPSNAVQKAIPEFAHLASTCQEPGFRRVAEGIFRRLRNLRAYMKAILDLPRSTTDSHARLYIILAIIFLFGGALMLFSSVVDSLLELLTESIVL